MRHCINENVQVHEAVGENLGPLLNDAAALVDAHEGVSLVHTQYDSECGYIVTAYLH